MVAMVTVFANHLFGWPHGGFIMVDVFFVISGFLITGNLLRIADRTGTVPFKKFYWNRVRRIVPAATMVLVLTYVASVLVFQPFRAQGVGVDALFAFGFLANWWFAHKGTDYFAASSSVSPLQHYWTLSIEEQFYFVWPAVIFLISVIVARKAWTHAHRMRIAGVVMGSICAMSLVWAIYQSAADPAAAYFNTFTRTWELGAGAMLAIVEQSFKRVPTAVKPLLSWGGLGLIFGSAFLLTEESPGFPAPWALMPVAGAALVIAAGVGREPKYQWFLRNPVSTYIGNISYSLYLFHWPLIVILGVLMERTPSYYICVLALAFGLAIASFHLVEDPFRQADRAKIRATLKLVRRRKYRTQRSSRNAALGVLPLLLVGLLAYAERPDAYKQGTPPPSLAAVTPEDKNAATAEAQMGPLATALHREIVVALGATEWPQLDPSMEAVITGPPAEPEVATCGLISLPDMDKCSWGSKSAPTRVVLVGDSIAMTYAGPLREIALQSGGRVQVHTEAMYGCTFGDDLTINPDKRITDACTGRKQHAIDVINSTKPQVVIIANAYGAKKLVSTGQDMTPGEWSDSLGRIVAKFRGSAQKIALVAPPPADKQLTDCYGTKSSTPADCISGVTRQWSSMAKAEQDVAKSIGQTWIDSRPWFCSGGRMCPAFVGNTATKFDWAHMAPYYGKKIYPVIDESLRESGVF
jgi:peptidoglycan/LPS O-acetylase OafA/YrhL